MFNLVEHLKRFWLQARRVVLVSTKPDPDEFKVALKITGLGIVVIGVIGFVIYLIFALLGGVIEL